MGRLAAILLSAALLGCAHRPVEQAHLRRTALALLLRVEEHFFRDDKLYCEEVAAGKPSGPAFCWSASQQLAAMARAARVEPFWRLRLADFIAAMDSYWIEHNGIGGYNVLPGPSPPDRYYDDNAWMALALLDAFDLTQDAEHLNRAIAATRFTLAGHDQELGGGIWWREGAKDSKHACSTAPALVACLRLYRITGDPRYLEIAEKLDAWIGARLVDKDGLVADHVKADGSVDRTKFSYNSAMMIRAGCLWFDITDNIDYLKRARRTADAGVRFWIPPPATAIRDDATFASMFAESLLELYRRDGDERWHSAALNAVRFVAFRNRDPAGWHPEKWNAQPAQPVSRIRLIDQAAAARAMLQADIVR